MEKKLHRDEQRKMIGGVCAGLADYFGVDVSIIRVLFVLTLILKGGGLIIYIILWIVLPVKNYIFSDPTVDYKVPPSPFGAPSPFDTPFRPKSKPAGTIVAGTILIMLGGYFLLDELDIIPDWDFSMIWPMVLIAVGTVFILTHGKKQPWEHDNWHQTTTGKDETNLNDNPPTI